MKGAANVLRAFRLAGARTFLAALTVLGATGVAHAADTPAEVIQRALGEAKKVAPNLRLVQLQFMGFGFATNKTTGFPDMTREGPPKGALFYFLAPRRALRVFMRMNRDAQYPPDVLKTLRERGVLAKDVEVDQLNEPHSPFTLPLADTFLDLGKAIDAAKNAAAADCAGEDPRMSSCRLVQTAELHMHWNERGDAAGPVWRITFGQHSRTLVSVERDVDAKTGRVIRRDAASRSSFTEPDQKPEQLTRVLLLVGRTFDALWPAVNDAVRKQDPRYRPYAVTLVTQLREYQRAPNDGYLWMAHIRFARATPSWVWDDLEAHVGWRADGQAVLDFSSPERLRGPRQLIPFVIDDRKLPSAEATLRAFFRQFPSEYFEEYTTFEWDESCRIAWSNTSETPMGDHVLRTTTTHSICGEFRTKYHRTDRVYFWLSFQDNRKWLFGVGPIDSEYEMVRTNAPKNSWTWWTRVKHAAYWQYFMVDPATGQGMTRCTAPKDGSSAIAIRSCP
jgi:hypothetical protein